MLLALTTVLVSFGTLSQNPTSGGYQLFERAVSGISADIQLASLDNFAPSLETASEYANAPNTADDVLLLPSPTAVGSARRAEPGVASHGGSLPTIGQGDTWLRGTSGNAGRVPSQVADQLSGQEFRNFDHFSVDFRLGLTPSSIWR